MLRKLRIKVWELFTLVWVIAIFTGCLMPAGDLPKAELFPNFDKVVHFTFYFVLALASLVVVRLLKKPYPTAMLLGAIFMMSFVIEVLQYFLPINRSFSGWDLLANLAGTLTGYLVFTLFVSTRLE